MTLALPGSSEYVYLASPYSAQERAIRQMRYEAARRACAWLLRRRQWTYSPIVHCHDIAETEGLPTDFEFWQDYNKCMLYFARAIYVLCIDGWRESTGVKGEMLYAAEQAIRIRYVAPLGATDYEIRLVP